MNQSVEGRRPGFAVPGFFKRLLPAVIFLICSVEGRGQALPPFQPEQDACHALQLCGTFYTPYSYDGYGNILELTQFGPNAGCFTESNSVWFKIEVATAGDIVFAITPDDPADDYDFIVHDMTNDTCTNLTLANRIRCNGNNNFPGSNPGGIVGLNMTSTLTFVAAGTFGSSFLQYISGSPGDVYLIMIDNYSGSSSGFTLDFTGTTATFVGDGNPVYDSLVYSGCDNSEGFTVLMNTPIRCSSIAADGSDFQLVPPAATVVSAVGVNCSGTNGYTQEIAITFSNPVPAGTYMLTPQTGTDGNTLLDLCLEPQLFTDSIPYQSVGFLDVDLGPDLNACIGASLQLNATITGGGVNNTIEWAPASYLSSATIINPVATPTASVTYIATVTPDGNQNCSKKDTLNINILQGFDLVNNDSSICAGRSVNMIIQGGAGYTFTWTPATGLSDATIPNTTATPDTTTTYTVTASYPGCVDSVQTITLTVEPIPVVYAGADQVLCYGDTLSMLAAVTPGWFGAYEYSWTPGGGFDDPSQPNPLYTVVKSELITLAVTTPAGCTGNDQLEITMSPQHFIELSQDTGVCPRDTAQLHVTGNAFFEWTPNYNISDTASKDPFVYPVTTTTYTVYGTNGIGCRDTQTVTVRVFPEAVISLPDSVTIYPGESYQIDPGGNGLYFAWFPPAGLNDASISNPLATPEVNTRYFVQAVTESGCSIVDSIDVYVAPDSWIDVPNAFTPGSEPNSVFRIVTRGNITLKNFVVFNRWGQKVFETTDPRDGWDGRLKGQPQPMGVYVYMVEAVTPAGRKFVKQGNVTLIR